MGCRRRAAGRRWRHAIERPAQPDFAQAMPRIADHRFMEAAQDAAQRRAITGRLAGMLFAVGAIVSAPANELFTDPAVGQAARWVDLLAFVSGIVCLSIPWRGVGERWFHLLPIGETFGVALRVWSAEPRGGFYAWYSPPVPVFPAYAFENRRHI